MSFLAPFWLLLAGATAVPLLLHLLRRNIATRVDFPAARYLLRAEQEHSRSMRIRNLLLMMLRVLLIAALALAAARPFINGLGVGHGPTALGIVLDNSLSTTAVVNGKPTFADLRDAARALAQASTASDWLWLVTADGRVRGGSRDAVLAEIERTAPMEDAGDLPLATRRAAAAVQGSTMPAKSVAIATDGQASAWKDAGPLDIATSVFVPAGAPPANRAVLAFDPAPARWSPRGALSARFEARDSANYRVLIGMRTLARGAVARGEPVQLRVAPPERGWQALRVELEPDDFAADDARWAAVWVGPPPRVTADASAGPFVSTALSSLVADGRATQGRGIRIASADAVDSLPALITPPADAVRLGAANRALQRLGIPWRYTTIDQVPSSARGPRLDGVNVTQRYHLARVGSAASDTLGTVSGEPWLVGGDRYVLSGSRMDPSATTFPLRAAFVPWLSDVIAIRLDAAAGDLGSAIAARPGARITVPADVDAWENVAGSRRSITPPEVTAPEERGVWFLLHGPRRVGAVVVNAPSGESALARSTAAALAPRMGPRARPATSVSGWVADAYAAGSRRPALTPLLVLALLLIAVETLAVRTTRAAA